MQEKQKSKKPLIKKGSDVIKYSGLAFQLAIYIIIGVFIGKYLDEQLANERPILTALCAIFFLAAGGYVSLKDLIKR